MEKMCKIKIDFEAKKDKNKIDLEFLTSELKLF